ncbi:hypothetical protein G3A39_42365 [Paraburkholderia aspalathi]|nr:hypothetical protein [Paraburkholderia aspalathi]
MNTEKLQERIQKWQADKHVQELLDLIREDKFSIFDRNGDSIDPQNINWEEMTRELMIARLEETFADFHDRMRVSEFAQGFAGLDQDSRLKLVEENASLFAPARARWLSALTDEECQHLQAIEPWQVFYHLTDSNSPILGVRDIYQTENAHSAKAVYSPAPKFARAA